LFEGGVRVPLIIRWPGVLPEGSEYTEPVSSLDLFPTLSHALGISLPDDLRLDGVNLLPYLIGEDAGSPHEFLYWRNGPNKAVRHGDWKMVIAGEHVWLFDLSDDIGETSNIAVEHPGIVKKLGEALANWESELPVPAWPSRPGNSQQIDGVTYEIHI